MSNPDEDRYLIVGIAGVGLIGASWAATFSAHGYRVRAWDPATDAETNLAEFLHSATGSVPGVLPKSKRGSVTFHHDKSVMLEGCSLVIESAPERLELKVDLLAELDELCEPEVIIATSTSSLLLSELSKDCVNKERVIVAHPFNPPHLLPLVELFGTETDIVEKAASIFRAVEKHPVVLKKEMIGHIANRLTSSMFREALYILEQGVASAEDIDACISEGPGVRWAIMGPFMGYHLGAAKVVSNTI